MSLVAALAAMLMVQAAAVSAPPTTPWHVSIQRVKDCTHYTGVAAAPDGSYVLGEDDQYLDAPFPYTREDAFRILLNTCEFKRALGPNRIPSLQVELVNVLLHQP